MSLWAVSPLVQAETTDGVRQLLQTNACENCDLSGADLRRLNLADANLQGANLQRAQLNFSDLSRANLSGAHLQHAELSGARFQGAMLRDANLSGAWISDPCRNLNTDIGSLDCRARSILPALDLDQCQGISADSPAGYAAAVVALRRVCLSDWVIRNVIFYNYSNRWDNLPTGINLIGADLRGANLSSVDLAGADLRYAQLAGTTLEYTDFTDALLMGADLGDLDTSRFGRALFTQVDVVRALAELLERQDLRDWESEAMVYIGAMNRAQQAQWQRHSEFAAEPEQLEIAPYDRAGAYGYEVTIVADDFVIHLARPQRHYLRRYMGLVYVVVTDDGETETRMIRCASDQPDSLRALASFEPQVSKNAEVGCPEGWEPLP
ncbi:MAG: pentapeptide repeat-containing protein [Cyanobacteria bacterium]|nr:pentapeptide repeat-containing protein [Cyanobacteriota bacterium]